VLAFGAFPGVECGEGNLTMFAELPGGHAAGAMFRKQSLPLLGAPLPVAHAAIFGELGSPFKMGWSDAYFKTYCLPTPTAFL